MMLSFVQGCVTDSSGSYCGLYEPVYLTGLERDLLRDSVLDEIDGNNVIWACQCSKETAFCE